MMQPKTAQLVQLTELLDTGVLKTVVERVLPLAQARQALELNEGGHNHGKIVLQVVN